MRFVRKVTFRKQKARKKQATAFKPTLEFLEEKVLPSAYSPTYAVHTPGVHPSLRAAASSSFTGNGLTPAQVRSAYGVNSITFQSGGNTVAGDGSGETIAIVDAYDDPSIAADLTTFDQQFGIAAPPTFTKVGVNPYGTASTTSLPTANSGWAGEIELDVEWAHAIAPKAGILLVEANSANDSDLMNAVDYARNYAGVAAVSMSWGGGESSGETQDDSHFTTPAGHTGVTFFASSGDSSSIGYPALSSHVIAVGGTALYLSGGAYGSESAWNLGGGGISQIVSQPSYQNNLVVHNGTQVISTGGMRAGPDVAYVADPNTGVAVYGSYGFGGWTQIGGTSAGSPQWAALMAIVDQGRATAGQSAMDGYTQTLPALYQLPSTDFHDVTTGANGNGDAAGPGFDLVTGRGSPIANLLVPALAGNTGTSGAKPPTVASAAHLASNTSTSVTLSVLGADAAGESNLTYTWTITGTSGTVNLSANGTNAAKNVTATFNQAGSYTFHVTITDPSNLSATSQVAYTVTQTTTSIKVAPASAIVVDGKSQQFTATAFDQFGTALSTQPSFSWSIDAGGVGAVNASTGVYTAPSSGTGAATVRATAGTLSSAASVSVVSATKSASTATLMASPVTYYWYGYPTVTLTMQLAPVNGVLPTGTVELLYNGSVLGTANVQIVNGRAIAQFQVQFSAYGDYTFTAQYMGSSSFSGSTSNSVTVAV